MAVRTYRDLDVYRESYFAALAVSRLTKSFPRLEQVELARQLRRAARSVPANIVEGGPSAPRQRSSSGICK